VPFAAGAAVCDSAVPPRPSSSDAELERRRVLLAKSDICPDSNTARRFRFYQRIREALAVDRRRPDFDSSRGHA
jgi:hypothetical protein